MVILGNSLQTMQAREGMRWPAARCPVAQGRHGWSPTHLWPRAAYPHLSPESRLTSPGPASATRLGQLEVSSLATPHPAEHQLSFLKRSSGLRKLHLIMSCLLKTSCLPAALWIKSKSLVTPTRPAALPSLLLPLVLVICTSDLGSTFPPSRKAGLTSQTRPIAILWGLRAQVPLTWSLFHGVISFFSTRAGTIPVCAHCTCQQLTTCHRPALL